ALKTLRGVGGFLREVFGTVPEDLIGVLGGDWLKVKRAENAAEILEKAQERFKARRATPKPASLSTTLPILFAAAAEDSDELEDLWARLLAATVDPSRAKFFRAAFIEATKKMDPLDAAVLKEVQRNGGRVDGQIQNFVAANLNVNRDQGDVSLEN